MTPMEILSHWAAMILPVAVIAALAALLPLLLARILPQRMGGLAVNLVVSVGILLAVSMAYFASFRPSNDLRMIIAAGEYFESSLWGVLRVGLLSAMIWGPIVLLVLAMQPSKWRPEL